MKMGRIARSRSLLFKAVAGFGLMIAGASLANASSIYDIQPGSLGITYNPGTSTLEIFSGLPGPVGTTTPLQTPITVKNGGTTSFMGDFDLVAHITASGSGPTFVDGTFTVSSGAAVTTFLAGSLTSFAFTGDASHATFEINFNRTGGPVSTDFKDKGHITVSTFNLTGFDGFRGGTFASTTATTTTTDITPVPTPATFASGAALLGTLALVRRRNNLKLT